MANEQIQIGQIWTHNNLDFKMKIMAKDIKKDFWVRQLTHRGISLMDHHPFWVVGQWATRSKQCIIDNWHLES